MMEIISKLSTICETYRGHDQLLALIGYNCTMISGLLPEDSGKRLKYRTIASQIVNCRMILRFLDDFTMLKYTISYGFGKQEKNIVIRVATVIGNICSQLYYPLEHIAWLADNKILKVKSDKFWVVSTLSWLMSSITSIISNAILIKENMGLKNIKKMSLSNSQIKLLLGLLKDFSYIILAIYWLPPGFLWSGKLSAFKVGLLGSIAISCNLIRSII